MPHTTPLTVEHLGERAQTLIHQMLDVHETPVKIAWAVRRITKETISVPAVARHARKYARTVQAQNNARRKTNYVVGEIVQQGGEIPDMLRAAFYEAFALAKDTGALRKMDPLVFEAAHRRRLELDLHNKQVSLAERRVQVFEDRLRLDRKKAHTAKAAQTAAHAAARNGAQSAIDKLDQKARRGSSVTVEEVQQIRELYGLAPPNEPM